MLRTGTRSTAIASALALATLLGAGTARAADLVLTFDGTVSPGGLDHEFIVVDVPEVAGGYKEIRVEHQNLTPDTILDWGLDAPEGFRGWGGGNVEPAIVGELAASRSYLTGPITPGQWKVVVGKAKLLGANASYHVVVTLSTAPSLTPQPERRTYVPSPPLSKAARWYAGDLHVHSIESGDARPPIEEVATFARSQGLDFVELSDHNTVSQLDFIDSVQASHGDLLLLPGVEYTTYAGHANGIGATQWVDHKIGQPGVDITSAAALFRAQDALFSINHPLYDLGNACIGCSWKHDLPVESVDAVEIATAGTGDIFAEQTLAFWDQLSGTGRHLAAVAGSDDHGAGQNLGSFSTPIGTPTTYVFAEGLSAASILSGIKHGKTVVKFHGVTDPMVELSSEVPIDGDTIHAESTLLHAKVTGAKGLTARWVKNGAPGDAIEIKTDPAILDLEVRAPDAAQDRYRVEVLRAGHPTTVTSHVWLETKSGVTGGVDDELRGGCNCATVVVDRSALAAPAFWMTIGIAGLSLTRRKRKKR